MKINQLKVPDELVNDIESGGRELNGDELSRLKELLNFVEAPQPKLYGREYIEECNQLWGSPSAKHYLGELSQSVVPGDIDPKQTLIIGEAEPDSPIALDYRTAIPRVVYLGDVDYKTLWIELSPDYASLVQTLQKAAI